MPRRKIREYDTKRLLRTFVGEVTPGLEMVAPAVQITEEHTMKKALASNPWLKEKKLVVKPDMLFGQRGKHGLILLNASYEEAAKFIDERMGEEISVNGCEGKVQFFLVEPFTKHKEEYYLSIIVERENYLINFSAKGGIAVEENWAKYMRTFKVPVTSNFDEIPFEEKVKADVPKAHLKTVVKVLYTTLKLVDKLEFLMIEFNPWTVLDDGSAVILDTRGEIDDCADFTSGDLWFDKEKNATLEQPAPFGKKLEPEEEYISGLDAKSGASLKLTIINRMGRIWTLVAGGGASVIYADTVHELGFGDDLGNYGEYSGGPNEEETYLYAKTVLKLLLESAELETKATGKPPRPRVCLIGGGIANFTDIAKTFKGIVHALKEIREPLKKANCEIFVRRAGPNYVEGLKIMRKLGKELGTPIHVNGPEVPMTDIIPQAIEFLKKE